MWLFDGPLDPLGDDVGTQLLIVLREALANVARHAHASRVDVEARATTLGGTMYATRGPQLGTVIEWRVPTGPA